MNYNRLSKVLRIKYARSKTPAYAIHPQLQFTKLGAFLRKFATEDSPVGELAHQAINYPESDSRATDPGDLELMPLHLLRDMLQEEPHNKHLLARIFNWKMLPEQVALDQDYLKAIREHENNTDQRILNDHHNNGPLFVVPNHIKDQLLERHKWANSDDLASSMTRIMDRNNMVNEQYNHIGDTYGPNDEGYDEHWHNIEAGQTKFLKKDPNRFYRE